MLFNSLEYLLFFPIVALLYFFLPKEAGRWFLLAASCFFYMYLIPGYILILALTITVDYFAAIRIHAARSQALRKRWLIASIAATCFILFVFKYYDFFLGNIASLAHRIGWHYDPELLGWILPVGLSFHTFQSLAYVIEVYRNNFNPERNFVTYSLYVMFFPQLVAGPIERPAHMLPQFQIKHHFDYDRFCSGLRLILWGVFKKAVIADKAALMVNEVYGHPNDFAGGGVLMATVLFALQIYCDFSGYSDMAIGSARCLGFNLSLNFKAPYLAQSLQAFWQRWHISLSSWFRDYVYIPLGGNRGSLLRILLNIMVVFALSGLWHGAKWTFICWGVLHGSGIGIGLIINRLAGKSITGSTLFRYGGWLVTIVFVSMAWIFFCSKDMDTATTAFRQIMHAPFAGLGYVRDTFTGLFTGTTDFFTPVMIRQSYSGLALGQLLIIAAAALLLGIVDLRHQKNSITLWFDRQPLWLRWPAYYVLIIATLTLGEFGSSVEFIYFQF